MQLSHTPAATSAVFDDPNLIGSAGLVPILRQLGADSQIRGTSHP